jgi:hypothetical protein
MGLLAQNPSQSAAWLKPACDWATFGKFGGSRQSTVKLPCVGPKIERTEISVRFHPWGAHTHTYRNLSPMGIPKSSPGGPAAGGLDQAHVGDRAKCCSSKSQNRGRND